MRIRRISGAAGGVRALCVAGVLAIATTGASEPVRSERYAWLEAAAASGSSPAPSERLRDRIPPPSGFERRPRGGMTEWLRGLPLLPGRPDVLLFDGATKRNRSAHHAVIDIDVGAKDLQQCADAVIRLRAEFLYATDCEDAITFDFTSGHPASWKAWREGSRPRVHGNDVTWERSAAPAAGWQSFRRYLDSVFTYAGSYSLERELIPVSDPSKIEPGDVFIQGGFPGHAVLVVDVVESSSGDRRFLLAQSYMPAQQIHVLRNPNDPSSPWYPARRSGPLVTPEWRFSYTDLRRFGTPRCLDRGSS